MTRLRLIAQLVAATLAAEAVYAAFTSPRFAVREVELRGDVQVVEQASARLQLPACLNMFRPPSRLLARQVEAVPAVRRARVARDWPHRLVVTMERREAVGVIRRAEQAMLVDPEGVIFALRDEWGWGLPELVGPHLTPEEVRGAKAKSELNDLLAVLRALGPEPRLRVTGLEMSDVGDIAVVLDSGTRVQLGGASDLGVKMRLLTAVVDRLGADHIAYADLSDPAAAYWRPRDGRVSALKR